MQTLEEFYINSWRKKSGYKELDFNPKHNKKINELFDTQWNNNFEKYMRNRLVMGSIRYGDIKTTSGYQYIPYLEKKLNNYKKTGNLEMLVDVANLAMLEFINSEHPLKNWSPLDNEKHCEKNQSLEV